MTITALGHFTIRCTPAMLPALQAFYRDVLGLAEGARPQFPFPGHWFYCGDKPIVHLAAMDASAPAAATGAFDHVAFSADDLANTRERLLAAGVPFFERPIPGYALQQLFTRDPSGIKVEQTFDVEAIEEAGDTHVCVNGTRLAVEVTGSGPPLLLLHGGAGSLRMFDEIEPLLRAHFRVIRYDQRDCGGSDTSPGDYDFDTLADDAVAVLEAMDAPRAHVLGTSFGGLLAQALAARHPRHVQRLVLSSTWPLGIPYAEINPQRAIQAGARQDPGTLAHEFFSASFVQRHASAAAFFEGNASAMSAARAALLKRKGELRNASITAPTLLLGGADDRIVPFERTRALAKTIAHASVTEAMRDVGHVGVIEAPHRVAELVCTFCG